MSDFEVGQKVVVKSGEGYINEGLTGVVKDVTSNPPWLLVEWDDGPAINGHYLAESFDVVEAEKVTPAEAIAAIVDKTYEEAFAAGQAEGRVASDEDKEELRNLFSELTDISTRVYSKLKELDVL